MSAYLVRGDHPLYMALYFAMIVFFTYFYVAITFNPEEVADDVKKYAADFRSIRAGNSTKMSATSSPASRPPERTSASWR